MITQPAAAAPDHLHALTGVRFFAALHVVVFHNAGVFDWAPGVVQDVINFGYTGVSMFFVLSGFILAYNYARPGRTAIDRRTFWTLRFVRIYPAYLTALLLALPLFLYFLARTLPPEQAGAKALIVSVPSLLLLQAWIPFSMGALNAPGWSLSVEAFLYLSFPFFALRLARCRTPRLLRVIATLWLLAWVPPLLHAVLVDDVGARLPGPAWLRPDDPMWNLLGAFPVLHVAQFAVGVGGGVLFHRNAVRFGTVASCVAEIALVTGLVAIFVGTASGWWPDALLPFGFLAVVYVPLFFVLGSGQGFLAKLSARPFLVLLGNASYGIYIFQQPVREWVQLATRVVFRVDGSSLGAFAVYLVILIAISIGTLRIEEHLRPWLRSQLLRIGAPNPIATVSASQPSQVGEKT